MKYPTEKDIVLINKHVIETYTPKEPIGVFDNESLNMTVNSVKQEVFGVEIYPSLTLKGANLFKNIAMKHMFLNGNKRTAFVSLIIFLELNDKTLNIPERKAIKFTEKKLWLINCKKKI